MVRPRPADQLNTLYMWHVEHCVYVNRQGMARSCPIPWCNCGGVIAAISAEAGSIRRARPARNPGPTWSKVGGKVTNLETLVDAG